MECKSYKKGDKTAILALFNKAFGKKMSLEYWEWRFLNNPFNAPIFIDLMWDNEKLVGHYAVSPVELLVDNVSIPTALSMTTMTHPEYGGRGIFTQLSNSVYEKLKKKNYEMVWGFPNNNSHYGFINRLKWNNFAIQGMMSLDISTIKSKLNKNISFSIIDSFNNSIKEQLNVSEKSIKINKTIEYLNWRYITNPTANYKILTLDSNEGVVVYKKFPSFENPNLTEIDIMDIYFSNNFNLLVDLLSAMIKSEDNVIKVNCWIPLSSAAHLLLEKARFVLSSPLTYFGGKSLLGNEKLLSYNNWDISLSYSDVF